MIATAAEAAGTATVAVAEDGVGGRPLPPPGLDGEINAPVYRYAGAFFDAACGRGGCAGRKHGCAVLPPRGGAYNSLK